MMAVYAPPGQPRARSITVAPLRPLHRRRLGRAGQGPVLREHLAGHRQAVHRVARGTAEDIEAALDAAHAAAPAWGRTSPGRALHHPRPRSPTASRPTSRRSPSPRPGTTASRSARPSPPTCRWPSTTSATSPACCAPRRAAISEIDEEHRRLPLPRAARRGRPDHPVELPDPHGGVEARPGARRRQRRRAQACRADPVVDPQAHRAHRRPAARRRLNVVNGFGVEAGKPLASTPRIAKIAFTGETTTGRLIMQYACQNIIPVTLELGGKSPNIFFEDVAAEQRRLLRQGARGLRDVRAQPGRGVHLPVARARPGVDLRRLRRRRHRPGRGRSSRATRSTPRR